jgi:hypothetical protein
MSFFGSRGILLVDRGSVCPKREKYSRRSRARTVSNSIPKVYKSTSVTLEGFSGIVEATRSLRVKSWSDKLCRVKGWGLRSLTSNYRKVGQETLETEDSLLLTTEDSGARL